MRKRPESGSIRRTFRGSDSDSAGPGASGGGSGGVRTASLPVGSALVKEAGEKRPVSAHSILNSVTRHSSLKTKVGVRLPAPGPFAGLTHEFDDYAANGEYRGHAGGESTVTQDDTSGTLKELQQPQTARS